MGTKVRLFLYIFMVFPLHLYGEVFDCGEALESLEEIQQQQLRLAPEGSSQSLLALEEEFDRKKADLTLLKGMQKLNQEYHRLKEMVRKKAIAPPPGKDDLIRLGNDVLKHHQTVQRVATADRILRLLSSHGMNNKIQFTFFKERPSEIKPFVLANLLKGNCHSQCDNLNALLEDGVFARNMVGLLSQVAEDSNQCGEKESTRNCRIEGANRFQKKVHAYRDELTQHIDPNQLARDDFAKEEWEDLEEKRSQLSLCSGECAGEMAALTQAIRSYREKVTRLEKDKDGAERAWSALKAFHDDANLIRTDRQFGVPLNQGLVDSYIRADQRDKAILKAKMTPQELSIATIKATQQTLVEQLTPDSHHRSREKLRQQFARQTHREMTDFFANSEEGLENRLEHFNGILNTLMNAPGEDFLQLKQRKITLKKDDFFKRLEALNEEQLARQKERTDRAAAATQKQLNSLSETIANIRKSQAFQRGDHLKHYLFGQFQKKCRQSQDATDIHCKSTLAPGGQAEVQILGKGLGNILAVMDDKPAPKDIQSFQKMCKKSSRYRSACSFVREEYRRQYPSGSVEEVLKRTRRGTIVYNSRGRKVDYIPHNNSGTELFTQGLAYALPLSMEPLMMFLTQGAWNNQLDSYVEWGQKEKSWYHQSEQYQEYANERWVEDMFNHFNPNFASTPPPVVPTQ